MSVMTRTRFEVVPLTRHIGAELRGIDLREKPDDETIRAIYQAWLDHHARIAGVAVQFSGKKSPRRSGGLKGVLPTKVPPADGDSQTLTPCRWRDIPLGGAAKEFGQSLAGLREPDCGFPRKPEQSEICSDESDESGVGGGIAFDREAEQN
jgi:hypothetical protein